ncbi:UNKNOWN [Stylonychia lemnae]|uniref:Uncharacterized protein n=1 Tax=Stylonychia lemnae TaxID=5949 RepID=A0A078AT84_STYLE|nr:UNKNOWN [Stylonychia lemnae]|eukprot:CDW85236.1 UNKNOWN [Stylonychia lemnae]
MYQTREKYSYVPQRNKASILSSGGISETYDINGNNMYDEMSNQSADDLYRPYDFSGTQGENGIYQEVGNPLEYEFNPKHFYWLFNPQIKFNKRKTFCVEDDLNPKDFMMMRQLNRKSLTAFLIKAQTEKTLLLNQSPENGGQMGSNCKSNLQNETDEYMSTDDHGTVNSPPVRQIIITDEDATIEDVASGCNLNEVWEDERIDQEAKLLLKERRLGQIIPSDAVAHLEFFYNTLLMSYNTENPFKNPEEFPALLYSNQSETPDNLFEIHRRIITPGEPTPDSNMDDELKSVSSLGKRYDWYPNRLIESPLSTYTQSPSPKKFNIQDRRSSQQFSLQIKSFDIPSHNPSPVKAMRGSQGQGIRRFTQAVLNPIHERFIEQDEN